MKKAATDGGPARNRPSPFSPVPVSGAPKSDASVRVHERRAVPLSEEREREGQVDGRRVFLAHGQRRGGHVERQGQRDRVVAAGPVGHEPHGTPVEVERVARHEQVATVGQERDAVRVGAAATNGLVGCIRGSGRAGRGPGRGRPGVEGQGVTRAVRSGAAPGDGIVGGGQGDGREERRGERGRGRAQERLGARAHRAILPVRPGGHARLETLTLKAL